jgi:hypothetical protein
VCSTSCRVNEVDALWPPGGSGRVERRGAGVLIEVRKIVPGLCVGQQRLVFGIENKSGLKGLNWPLVMQED